MSDVYTSVANLVIPTNTRDSIINLSKQKTAIWDSGIVTDLTSTLNVVGNAGTRVPLPFFNDLTGDPENLVEDTALTVSNITESQDIAVVAARGKAFGATDLAAAFSGEDPLGVIESLFGNWWKRAMQSELVNLLQGTLNSTVTPNKVYDISAESGELANISASTLIDAKFTLGDSYSDLTAIIIHSQVHAALAKLNLVDVVREADQSFEILKYGTGNGVRVITDDGVPVSGSGAGTTYTSYLFGPGAVAFADAPVPVPVETFRDELKSQGGIINRRHFVLHLRGVKFDGSPAATSPTRAELTNAANWTQVYDDLDVRAVAFIHLI